MDILQSIVQNTLRNIFSAKNEPVVINKTVYNEEFEDEEKFEDFSDISNPEIINHLDAVNEQFSFLTDELGFSLVVNRFYGRELTKVYMKDNIEVHIVYETGSLPWVTIRNSNLPYDDISKTYNFDIVDEFEPRIREIKEKYSKQNNKQSRQNQHIEYLIEAAKTVRYNIENRIGKLK